MKRINLPIDEDTLSTLQCFDQILISGTIFCGRDAVLPRVVSELDNGNIKLQKALSGGLVFHTAVSVAGLGPTSSNKYEIESSVVPLSKYGVKIHLGKGELHKETMDGLKKYGSIYCVIPPVTALLNDKTISKEIIMCPELGMEAFYKLEVVDYPAIVAVIRGKSIYEK